MFRRPAADESPWVCVYRASGPTDVYLVRDWLERNEVPCQVRGESLMTLRGEIPIPEVWPSIWVLRDHASVAEDLVRTFEGPALVHPEWVCSKCGEQNGATFGSCWSCGQDSPFIAGGT